MLALAATIAALAGGSALAQQTPSDTGTDANGPITIVKNLQSEPDGTVRVDIDGQEVDHLTMADYDDITGVVHPGLNTLTLSWTVPLQRLNFKIAYAPTRNNFRNILVIQDDAARDPALRRPGSRSITFSIPAK